MPGLRARRQARGRGAVADRFVERRPAQRSSLRAELDAARRGERWRASASARWPPNSKAAGRLKDWIAGGISATHHTAGRIDRHHNQVRRAICWNDQTLAAFRARGERRIGGAKRVRELIGGPWADRYTLSHLVKDEDPDYFPAEGWQRTYRILPHGPLAAGYLTGNFDVISVSAAASTGMMDLRKGVWCPGMLERSWLRRRAPPAAALSQLPRIVDHLEPIGPLSENSGAEAGLDPTRIDRCSFRPPTISRRGSSAAGPSTAGRWPSFWETRPSSIRRPTRCPARTARRAAAST